jgi:hypothetical protein
MYRVKEDISIGFNSKKNIPNVLFKKGDLIDGNIEDKYIFNSYKKGILAKPTVIDSVIETPDGKHFLLLEQLEKVDDNNKNYKTSNLSNPEPKSLTSKQKGMIGLSLIVGGVFLLLLSRNIAKN